MKKVNNIILDNRRRFDRGLQLTIILTLSEFQNGFNFCPFVGIDISPSCLVHGNFFLFFFIFEL